MVWVVSAPGYQVIPVLLSQVKVTELPLQMVVTPTADMVGLDANPTLNVLSLWSVLVASDASETRIKYLLPTCEGTVQV